MTDLALSIPPELLEAIAERAAAILAERVPAAEASPFASVDEAADYLRCDRQRIYDLLSARRLTRFKDGSRVLIARAELEAYLACSPAVAPALRARTGSGRPA